MQVRELADDLRRFKVFQFQIQQQQIRMIALKPGDGFRPRSRGGDLISLPFQSPDREPQEASIIIDHEKTRGWWLLAHAPRQVRTSGTCTSAMNNPTCLIASANFS